MLCIEDKQIKMCLTMRWLVGLLQAATNCNKHCNHSRFRLCPSCNQRFAVASVDRSMVQGHAHHMQIIYAERLSTISARLLLLEPRCQHTPAARSRPAVAALPAQLSLPRCSSPRQTAAWRANFLDESGDRFTSTVVSSLPIPYVSLVLGQSPHGLQHYNPARKPDGLLQLK